MLWRDGAKGLRDCNGKVGACINCEGATASLENEAEDQMQGREPRSHAARIVILGQGKAALPDMNPEEDFVSISYLGKT